VFGYALNWFVSQQEVLCRINRLRVGSIFARGPGSVGAFIATLIVIITMVVAAWVMPHWVASILALLIIVMGAAHGRRSAVQSEVARLAKYLSKDRGISPDEAGTKALEIIVTMERSDHNHNS